jgi:hypothetical protein
MRRQADVYPLIVFCNHTGSSSPHIMNELIIGGSYRHQCREVGVGSVKIRLRWTEAAGSQVMLISPTLQQPPGYQTANELGRPQSHQWEWTRIEETVTVRSLSRHRCMVPNRLAKRKAADREIAPHTRRQLGGIAFGDAHHPNGSRILAGWSLKVARHF